MKINEMNFSEQIKYIRMKLKLSQSESAKGIGVSVITVSRWERENIKPQIATLGKLYDFCKDKGVDIEAFLLDPRQMLKRMDARYGSRVLPKMT